MNFNHFLSKVSEIGETKLGPAIGEAVSAASNFHKDHIAPSVTDALMLGQMKIIPAVDKVGRDLGELGQNKVAPVFQALGVILEKFSKVTLESALSELGKTIEEHPVQAAILGASAFVFFCPTIVNVPIMWATGWTSAGVRGELASVASALQAATGDVAAGSVFAYLQSAAMGGYGAGIIDTLTSVGAGAVAAAILGNENQSLWGHG